MLCQNRSGHVDPNRGSGGSDVVRAPEGCIDRGRRNRSISYKKSGQPGWEAPRKTALRPAARPISLAAVRSALRPVRR